jgi:serine/threonine protein kinase
MEFCDGGDLQQYHVEPCFTKSEYSRVMLELLDGVSYLHERNIAHRDIKPQNVNKSRIDSNILERD